MSFKINEINPHNSPKEFLNRYIDFIFKLHLEKSPKDPFPTNDILLKRLEVEEGGAVRIREENKMTLSKQTDKQGDELKLFQYFLSV